MPSSTRSSDRRRRRRAAARALTALSLAVSLTAAAPALADGARAEAKALTEKAEVEYNVGHFPQALDLYSKAYEKVPSPALLFDIGQCHKMLKDYERALFFFRGYLREQPSAPNRPLVVQLIAESQSALDAQRAADAQKRAAAAPPAARAPATPEPAAPAIPVAPPPPASAESPAASRGSPALRIAGIVTAGAGVVLVGTGVYFGLHAASLSNEIAQLSSSHGTWSARYQSDYDAGQTSAHVANALYAVGAVALVAGGVLTYLGWPKGHATVTTAIAPAPGGGSVAVAGRF